MHIISIEHGLRYQAIEGETISAEYLPIPGTSPGFRNHLAKRKDRKYLESVVAFLSSHAIDATLRLDQIGRDTSKKPIDYNQLELLAFARSEELFRLAFAYLNSEATNPYKRGMPLAQVMYPLGYPARINGPMFSAESLEDNEFKELSPDMYLRVRLNPMTRKRRLRVALDKHPKIAMLGMFLPPGFYRTLDILTPTPIDLTIVSESVKQ